MALIRPSLTLVLDVDERLASEDTKLELNRCYTYICSPLVRDHAPENDDAPISNVARAIVTFGNRDYLYSKDEGADELWNSVVEQWIGNMLHKIGSNMKAFNRRQRKIGLPEVVFDKFDFELQGGEFVVSLHPDLLGFVPEELNAAFSLARSLLNDGTFEGAKRVRIPADSSYAAQQSAAKEVWDAEHANEGDGANSAEAESANASEGSNEQGEGTDAKQKAKFAPKPEHIDYDDPEWLEADKKQKSYENTAVPITDSEELPPIEREEEVEPPEPFSFEVDYGIWEVEFGGGKSKIYDSSALKFVG